MTLDYGHLVIMGGYPHVGVIDRGQDTALRNRPDVQRAVIQRAVESGVIEVVPGHVHQAGAVDEGRDDAVRNPPKRDQQSALSQANHKTSLLPPRLRGFEDGDLTPGPGQGHRHPRQVGHHDVRLRRGRLAQTMEVLKPLGLDIVALNDQFITFE